MPLVKVEAAVEPERPVVLILDRNPIRRAMWSKIAPHAQLVFAMDVEEAVRHLQNGGIAQLLIDDSAIRDDGVDAALARIVTASDRPLPIHLLWPEGERVEGTILSLTN